MVGASAHAVAGSPAPRLLLQCWLPLWEALTAKQKLRLCLWYWGFCLQCYWGSSALALTAAAAGGSSLRAAYLAP